MELARRGTPLSPREDEILRLRADGLQHKEIAHRLGMSTHTVKNHTTNAYKRLGVRTLIEALHATKRI